MFKKKLFQRKLSLDQFIALLLVPPILVVLALLYLLVVPIQGRPFLFSAERMRNKSEGFSQLKIRTMQPLDDVVEQSVLGGDLYHRVTPIGAFLRKTRLDELPQIFNVLRGDMVFIGPRPPLRKYLEINPDYAASLSDARPGITGLATVLLHKREERILAACTNSAETDRMYQAHCIPRKIRLDRLYQRKKSTGLKLFILWRTVSRLSVLEATAGLITSASRSVIGLIARVKDKSNMSGYPSRSARLK